MSDFPLRCENCGVHFALSPGDNLNGAITNGLACPECGGKRFYRHQPSPTHSEMDGGIGTVRDTPEPGQPDPGGNPLGEGTIVGNDHEDPGWKRDNYTHSKLANKDWSYNVCPACGEPESIGPTSEPNDHYWYCESCDSKFLPPDVSKLQREYQQLLNSGNRIKALDKFNEIQHIQNMQALDKWHEHRVTPIMDRSIVEQQHPDPWMDNEPGTLTFPQHWTSKSVMSRTLDMEPYMMDGLFDLPLGYREAAMTRQAGFFALPVLPELAADAAALIGGGEAAGAGAAAAGTAAEGAGAAAEGAGAAGAAEQAAGGGARQFVKDQATNAIKGQIKNQIKKKILPAGGAGALLRGALGNGSGGAGPQTGTQAQSPGGLPGEVDNATVPGGLPNEGYEVQTFRPAIGIQTSVDIPMILLADLETSDSIRSVGEQNDNPEKQDQKEFNDGDKSPSNLRNPNNEDSGASGEDGVRQRSEGYGFGPNSPAIDRLMMMLPLVLHYYQSEESGEQDPLIRGLHEMLESENPNYLKEEHPDGHSLVQEIIQLHRPSPHHAAFGPLRDPLVCASCGGEMTEPTSAQGKWMNHCTKCGRYAGVPSNYPLLRHQQQALPEYPELLQSVGPDRPWVTSGFSGMVPEKWTSPNTEGQPNQVGSRCPNCGGVTNPDGSCPQCGTRAQQPGLPSTPARTGNHQANLVGPQTPEQQAVVIQYLIDHGREQETPNVELHPEQYAKELAEITQQANVPPLPDPSQVTPLQAAPSAPGGMPVPDPGASAGPASGAPMQPMSGFVDPYGKDYDPWELGSDQELRELHTCPSCHRKTMDAGGYCSNCDYAIPGEGFPVSPDMAGRGVILEHGRYRYGPPKDPRLGTRLHQGADSVAPRCPHCGSGSTGLRQSGGDDGLTAECSACHKLFDVSDQIDANKYKGAKLAADSVAPRCPHCGSGSTGLRQSSGDDGITAECHSCHKIFDVSDKIDANKYKGASFRIKGLVDVPNPALVPDQTPMAWKDTEGNDLAENQTYIVSSAAFPIPDVVKILKVHPSHLDVKIADGQAPSINPDENTPDFQIKRKEAQLDDYQFTPSDEQADIDGRNTEPPSGTPGLEQVPPSGPTTDEVSDSFPHTTISALVDDSEDEDHCRKCGSTMVDHMMRDENTTFHECVPCGHAWESKDDFQGREASVDLSWLVTNDDGDDFRANMDRHLAMRHADRGTSSRNLSSIAAKDPIYQRVHDRLNEVAMQRQAGRKFTPGEKRELIRERGSARNLEDLDLTNTHYDIRDDYTGKANGLNVDDDHLFLGI